MRKLSFPAPFMHRHAPVQDVNELVAEKSTRGERAADWVAGLVGSWPFIVGQSLLLALWLILNVTAWISHWDPYPFILMNLFLSTQAAFTAPIIMMSQKRQSTKDRIEAHNDFLINMKAEEEVRIILEHLEAQDTALALIHEMLVSQKRADERY
jgi:uncharacterized membrane protein